MNNKEELIQHLTSMLQLFKHKRKEVKRIKESLLEYNISGGDVQQWINDPSILQDEQKQKELLLFAEAVFSVTGTMNVNPQNYFTTRQIKEVKTNFIAEESDKVSFPLTFNNVIKISEDMYYVSLTDRQLKMLVDSNLLQYNFETQREARFKTEKSGEIIQVAKVVPTSIREIKQLRKSGELFSTVLTFNARIGSSDVGEELEYDNRNNTLTITEGTLLDCLDGFHRLTAITQALTEDPSMEEMTFMCCIVNYSVRMAQNYFSQTNTTNPISKSRLKIMKDSQSSFIIKQLQAESELRGKIIDSDHIAPYQNFLVTASVLTDALDEIYDIRDKPSAIQTSKYLIDFFNKLILNFYEEFSNNLIEVRKNSLINANQIIGFGYILIAKRMQDENIPLNLLPDIISNINFDRSNSMWLELDIVDNDGNIRSNVKSKIKKYFANINLNKVGV